MPPGFWASARLCLIALLLISAPSAFAQTGSSVAPEVVWTFRTGGPIWGSSTSQDGTVYFGSTDGTVYALDVATGQEVWRFATGGPIYGSVRVYEGRLYVSSDDGVLYKLDPADGHEIWRSNIHELTPQTRYRPADHSPNNQRWDFRGSTPTEADGTVYVGSPDTRLYAVDAETGTAVWHFEAGGTVRSSPVVAGAVVIVGSFDGRVYAVDRATGEEVWRYSTGGVVSTSAVVHEGVVYIGSRSGRLYALDLETGTSVWQTPYGQGSWVESTGVVYDGRLYIGSSFWSRQLAIHPQTGRTEWTAAVGGAAYSTPALTEDAHYSGTVGLENTLSGNMVGALHRLDRASGEVVWSYPFEVIEGHYDHGVAATPEIVDGLILFGALDDVFYAMREVDAPVGAEPGTQGRFGLLPNAPNPFGSSTALRYRLGTSAHVRLVVHDLLGRELVRLVDGPRGPGDHALTWDGRLRSGLRVPAGTYVCTLHVDGQSASRPLVLVN